MLYYIETKTLAVGPDTEEWGLGYDYAVEFVEVPGNIPREEAVFLDYLGFDKAFVEILVIRNATDTELAAWVAGREYGYNLGLIEGPQ